MIDLAWINPGILEVYYGPMKAGKGEELIYRLKPLMRTSTHPFIAFKPSCDDRDQGIIYSRAHTGITIPAIKIPEYNPKKILEYITPRVKVVVLDETQFFHKGIVGVVDKLLKQDKNVIIAGLDLDFRGESFGYMFKFIQLADYQKQLYANCDYVEKDVKGYITFKCTSKASRTQRLVNGLPADYNDTLLVTGDTVGVTHKDISYEPRCEKHHFVDKK